MKVKFINSPNKKYKLRAIFTDDNDEIIKEIDFGASGYKDFIIYNQLGDKEKAKERRKLYIKRHKKNEDWSDPMTKGTLSRFILWEKPTLRRAINNFIKKFNL